MPYQSTDALGPKSEVEVDIKSDQAPFSIAYQTRSYSKFCLFISVVVSRFILFRFVFCMIPKILLVFFDKSQPSLSVETRCQSIAHSMQLMWSVA
jgi:hypothetical protein